MIAGWSCRAAFNHRAGFAALALAALGLAALGLAACAQRPPAPAPPRQTIVVAQPLPRAHAHNRAVPRPRRKPPAPESDNGIAAKAEPASAEAETEIAAAAMPVPSPGDLVGIDQRRAVDLLGIASETAEQPPGTVWRYKAGQCELDLVFYMEMRSGRMRSLHYQFKGDAHTAQQRQACLKSIIDRNRKPEPS